MHQKLLDRISSGSSSKFLAWTGEGRVEHENLKNNNDLISSQAKARCTDQLFSSDVGMANWCLDKDTEVLK